MYLRIRIQWTTESRAMGGASVLHHIPGCVLAIAHLAFWKNRNKERRCCIEIYKTENAPQGVMSFEIVQFTPTCRNLLLWYPYIVVHYSIRLYTTIRLLLQEKVDVVHPEC